MSSINLKHYLSQVNDYFSPKVIGEVNDAYIKVAKINGDKIPWHNHEDEDELFLIVEGSLLMEIQGQDSFVMEKGDIYVVKKGINHRVSSDNECHIMLVENKTTRHTGDVKTDITRSIDEQL